MKIFEDKCGFPSNLPHADELAHLKVSPQNTLKLLLCDERSRNDISLIMVRKTTAGKTYPYRKRKFFKAFKPKKLGKLIQEELIRLTSGKRRSDKVGGAYLNFNIIHEIVYEINEYFESIIEKEYPDKDRENQLLTQSEDRYQLIASLINWRIEDEVNSSTAGRGKNWAKAVTDFKVNFSARDIKTFIFKYTNKLSGLQESPF